MKSLPLFFYASLLLSQFSYGQVKPLAFPMKEKVDNLMNEAMKNSDLPAVVAIAINNKNQQVAYTYGKAIWNQNAEVTTKNIFRIYSMTKLVTSIAAMQLVEKGLVGLDDELSYILPDMTKIPILSDGKFITPKNPITYKYFL